MKVLFIESKKKAAGKININGFPDKIHLLYTIQYKRLAEKLKEKLGKRVLAFEQVLGCSKIKPKAPLLLAGSGRFHALQLAFSTGKPVFIYDNKLTQINKEEIERFKAIQKGKIIKFLSSDNIGLIVSSKPGQNKLKQALKQKKILEKKYPKKRFYIFISDTININELENFPYFFLNFACPGIEFDSPKILNYENLI